MADDLRDRPRLVDPIGSSLSELFVKGLPIDGASISVVALTGNHSVVSTTGPLAAVTERLQFDLGEGPHWDALATGRPVLIGDVAEVDAGRWPAFRSELGMLEVGGMFSLPMALGAATVGVVDLLRHRTGTLSDAELNYALSLTRAITPSAVQVASKNAESPASVGEQPEMRREVHQATGMLAAQLDTSTTNALAALRAYSYAQNRAMQEVASDIVSRRLDLSSTS